MKNIALTAVVCLIVFASCQKTADVDATFAAQTEKTVSVCTYDAENLLANSKRRKPNSPKPTDTTTTTTPPPTTTDPTPTSPTPTGTNYSCILIDFDGQTVSNTLWNSGATINCAASGLSSSQITEVLNEVRALYGAYNIYVTYDEAVYNAANPLKRTRVIVTPTSAWYGGVSGVAYTGSFTWGDGTPAFVFSDRLYYTSHYVAEIVAHEAGHTLGLRHQTEYDAYCNLVSRYRNGAVMGNSLNSSQGQWIYGTTTGCNIYQDDNAYLSTMLGRL